MLTSANRPRWAGCRAGLWLRYAAVKIGPAPLAPRSAPRKGHYGLALPTSAAGYELAGRMRPQQRGAALDRPHRLRASPAPPGNPPWSTNSRQLRVCPQAPTRRPDARGRSLSRARRQPRLAAASRRFAVANARVDRCARLRRRRSMDFDGTVRPFGPDVRVKAHGKQGPEPSEPPGNRPLTNQAPYEPGLPR
jgi:hypothetical protein